MVSHKLHNFVLPLPFLFTSQSVSRLDCTTMRSTVFAISALVALTAAAPLRHTVERRSFANLQGWSLHPVAEPSGDMIIPLRVGLHQQNLDQLDAVLHSVSHPDSEEYGQHWDRQRVADFFRPKEESALAVEEWLAAETGLAREAITRSESGQWIEAHITLKQAEQLLAAKYKQYIHAESEMTRVGE